MSDVEELLRGTPYLIDTDAVASERYAKAYGKADDTRSRALATTARIRDEAAAILGPYIDATRMDLVTESNRIEGIEWNPQDVREVVLQNQALLSGPRHALTETVRADPKLYEVLGLYRAHEIADTWLEKDHVPRAADIRELHKIILGDVRLAGTYKQYENQISGRPDHRTTPPIEVARVMLELADWWATSEGDPLLTATVIHAWLAHAHPFEDGNGRLARILANLQLARHGYSPLILRAQGDRGEYYSALHSSDDGDILPLYELFERAIRRQTKIMARPRYVQDIIDDRLLASEKKRFELWSATLHQLTAALSEELRSVGADIQIQGTLSLPAFSLLCARDADGNGWYAKVYVGGTAEWLLWFGFRTKDWDDMAEDADNFPSIFVSRRDRRAEAQHPYAQVYDASDLRVCPPEEIHLLPARRKTVSLRAGFDVRDYRLPDAARAIVRALTSSRYSQ